MAAAAQATVANTEGFTGLNYVVIGQIGSEKSELRRISSISSVILMNFVDNPFLFPHPTDTVINYIKYNQTKIYRSPTKNGTYALQATLDLEVDYPDGTRFEDTAGVLTDWYKASYYNSTTSSESDLSDAFQATGIPDYCLRGLQDAIVTMANDPYEERIDRRELTRWMNEKYRDIQIKVREKDEKHGLVYLPSNAMVADQAEYDLPIDCWKLWKVETAYDANNYNLAKSFDLREDNPLNTYDTNNPLFYNIGLKIGFLPIPDTSVGLYKLWYYQTPAMLASDGDELVEPYKQYTDIFINYGMYRFCLIHKSQMAAQYQQDYMLREQQLLTDISPRQVYDNVGVVRSNRDYTLVTGDEII